MAVEYDLVILGGTVVAREAAIAAAAVKARVALVEPFPPNAGGRPEALYHAMLAQTGQAFQPGLMRLFEAPPQPTWPQVVAWTTTAIENLEQGRSPAILSAQGVDVITGGGEFCRLPKLGFVVQGRTLRSRHYLIATGSRTAIPEIPGLSTTQPLTPEDLWQAPERLQDIESLLILGSDPLAIALAQQFNRLGIQVMLVLEEAQLLPQEDPEVAALVLAILEAEGVGVLTRTAITQVRQLEGKNWVQAGTQALETDAILIATGQQPLVQGLNLEGVGVRCNDHGVWVNEKLQTTQPRIYACGSVIRGDAHPAVAIAEAHRVLKNTLGLPLFKMRYEHIPWAVLTDPPLARVGLTEPQAREVYGQDVTVSRQYFKTLPKAQAQNTATGLCKLIARRNGTLLGLHLVGAGAEEVINIGMLAMQRGDRVQTLAGMPVTIPSHAEILQQTAQNWVRDYTSKFRLDLLDNWFDLRRSWSK
jgi:pyruvate/2-oxoglutarate dehydrogenase complex dihydrolipoamide dehydrogenase (E3) component